MDKSSIIIALLCLIILGGGVYILSGGPAQPTSKDMERAMESFNEVQVNMAADSEKQYYIVQKSGDALQTCTQARIVAMTYLQVEDEKNYLKWKEIEKADCAAVGIRR